MHVAEPALHPNASTSSTEDPGPRVFIIEPSKSSTLGQSMEESSGRRRDEPSSPLGEENGSWERPREGLSSCRALVSHLLSDEERSPAEREGRSTTQRFFFGFHSQLGDR